MRLQFITFYAIQEKANYYRPLPESCIHYRAIAQENTADLLKRICFEKSPKRIASASNNEL